MSNHAPPVYGNGKICYIELPSENVNESASFYSKVFGWEIRTHSDGAIAFDDAINQVSGTWRTDRKPFTELGILIHIMVNDIEGSMKLIIEHGGKITQPAGLELPEVTARFSDPSGNILGLYQQPS